jgi:hypothetical protein
MFSLENIARTSRNFSRAVAIGAASSLMSLAAFADDATPKQPPKGDEETMLAQYSSGQLKSRDALTQQQFLNYIKKQTKGLEPYDELVIMNPAMFVIPDHKQIFYGPRGEKCPKFIVGYPFHSVNMTKDGKRTTKWGEFPSFTINLQTRAMREVSTSSRGDVVYEKDNNNPLVFNRYTGNIPLPRCSK